MMLVRVSREHCCAGWVDALKITLKDEVLSESNLTVRMIVWESRIFLTSEFACASANISASIECNRRVSTVLPKDFRGRSSHARPARPTTLLEIPLSLRSTTKRVKYDHHIRTVSTGSDLRRLRFSEEIHDHAWEFSGALLSRRS